MQTISCKIIIHKVAKWRLIHKGGKQYGTGNYSTCMHLGPLNSIRIGADENRSSADDKTIGNARKIASRPSAQAKPNWITSTRLADYEGRRPESHRWLSRQQHNGHSQPSLPPLPSFLFLSQRVVAGCCHLLGSAHIKHTHSTHCRVR